MDPRSFKIFTREWVQLKHVSAMKCHNYSLLHTNWRFSYTVHYHIQNFALTFLGVIGRFMR